MRCPYCQYEDSRVLDSRTGEDGAVVRRRRECPRCRRRFTTYERVGEVRVMVVKKDGRREPFDGSKIAAGMRKALEKRPVPPEQIQQVVEEIERRIKDELREEVTAAEIGEMVMERLRQMDEVAYLRFASVYKEFGDVESFLREAEALGRSGGGEPAAPEPENAGVVKADEA